MPKVSFLDKAWKVITIFCTLCAGAFTLGWYANDYLWTTRHQAAEAEWGRKIGAKEKTIEDLLEELNWIQNFDRGGTGGK